MVLDLGHDDCNNLPELSPEELKQRQKEMLTLNDEAKEMFSQIKGKQNSRVISLDSLFYNIAKDMSKSEEEDDDFISDCEYSVEFLRFMQWYIAEKNTGKFLKKYQENLDIFEDILNRGLEKEDVENILTYMTPEQRRQFKMDSQEMPMSGLEIEALKRFEKLSTTGTDLVALFLNIKDHEGDSWERFSEYLPEEDIDESTAEFMKEFVEKESNDDEEEDYLD